MNTKNKVLILLSIFTGIVVYKMFITKTIDIGGKYYAMNHSVQLLDEKWKTIRILDSISNVYNSFFQDRNSSIDEYESILLQKTAYYSDSLNLKLIQLKQYDSKETDRLPINYTLKFQGNFEPSLLFIQKMEYSLPFTELLHVKMETKNKISKKQKILETEIIIQFFP